ncbi:hypothetical protein [Cupriavidus sp. 8B]
MTSDAGQRLFVFPDLDFVLAVTAGNYDTPGQWIAPVVALRQVFLTSLAGECPAMCGSVRRIAKPPRRRVTHAAVHPTQCRQP